MTALTNAYRLDWKGWLIGAAHASISGGTVVLAGWQLSVPMKTVLKIAGFSAFVSLCKYLQTTPTPLAITATGNGAEDDGSARKPKPPID
jgi:hypothetical protein